VEESIKVIVVGNGGVGKSSLVQRFCKGKFTSEYKKTIGADFLERECFVRSLNTTVTLMLWDTAGQEVFDALTARYYRGAGACVLAFSTTDRDSFEAVESWKNKVEAVCGKGEVVMCLIQTKIDLIDEGVVSPEEAEALAKKLQVKFFRTSTKDNLNVDLVFEYLAESHLKYGSGGDGANQIEEYSKKDGRPASVAALQTPESSISTTTTETAPSTATGWHPKPSSPPSDSSRPPNSGTEKIKLQNDVPATRRLKKKKCPLA